MPSRRTPRAIASVIALGLIAAPFDLAGQVEARQVLLEVKFLEVSRDVSGDLGTRVGLGGAVNGIPILDRNARVVAAVGKTFTDFEDQNVLNLNAGVQVDLPANSIERTGNLNLVTIPRITPYGTVEIEIESVSFSIPNVPVDRRTETGLVLGGGTRMVLGGLARPREGAANAKLPILADIAVLGRFFKNSSKAEVRAGLLIFVTPSIVRGSGDD